MHLGTSVLVSLITGLVFSSLLSGCHRGAPQSKEPSSATPGPQVASTAQAMNDESQLVGDWRGESKVQVPNTAAKDEVVVWHIAKGNALGRLSITADKIVNGKTINMGTLEFQYDPAQKTIICENERGVWKLTSKGNTLEGTLTLPDRTVLRRVTLERR